MTEKELFEYYVSMGFTPEGTAALLANFRAESNFNPKNLQNSSNKKLNMTDDEYTAKVDSGEYTNFVRDSAGYGYAQWTYWSRKENLLKFAREQGFSIGDGKMQAAFAYAELQGYKAVFQILKTSRSIEEACDIVMTGYEKPADQSEGSKENRRRYAREIYGRYMNTENPENKMTERQIRQAVVNIAISWFGRKEADGSHRQIIDLYNSFKPLARGYVVQYTDSWCATFCSAVAIKAGLTEIIPRECSCGKLIQLFQSINRWVENDAYVPELGDWIFYDWDDDGIGDCTDWPEHVGIVVTVSGNTIQVCEGNKNDAVGYRTLTVNGRYIRGYGIPDYASKATGDEAEDKPVTEPIPGTPEESGNKGGLSMKPIWVGVVTADTLNVRKWGGKEYSTLKSIPQIHKGDVVEVCDKVKAKDGATWLYIRIEGRVFGFVHSDYIQKSESGGISDVKHKVGDVIQFTGTRHYTSTNAKSESGKACEPGKAKVTAVHESGKHPYHLINERGGGSTVYGWVDAADIKNRM